MSEYPLNLVRKRYLFDGTEVTVRPIRPEDAPLEQDFVRRLSEDSRYFRFMKYLLELPENKLKYFTQVDYDRHMAFVATVMREDKEVEIGVARYAETHNPDVCEFAIAVDDAWQGTGLAGMLMIPLLDAAREHGFKTMEGLVLRANHKMLKFARQLGFEVQHQPDDLQTVRIVRPL